MLLALSLSDAAAAATACGVVFAAWALYQQRGQARTDFEDSVVRQYRELIKPDLVLDGILQGLSGDLSETDRVRVHRIYLYLDLCNEQVFLRAIGRVSRSTWKVQWSDGIKDNLTENEVIRSTWLEIQSQTSQFQELHAFQQTGWRDPRGWEPVWRRPLVRFGLATVRVPMAEVARTPNRSELARTRSGALSKKE